MNGIAAFLNKVIEGDCLNVLDGFPDRSVDMVLCDLPYGLTKNPWDEVIDLDKLWMQYKRIIKLNGVILLTGMGLFTGRLMLSNPDMFRYKLVWVKSRATNFLNVRKQPLRKHEDVCVFYNGTPTYHPQITAGEPYSIKRARGRQIGCYANLKQVDTVNVGTRYPTDVLYQKAGGDTMIHPSQKPVELGRYLIRTYSNPGDIVLDNACGSGSFLVAALLENRQFIGIEKNSHSFRRKSVPVDFIEVCNRRIAVAKAGIESTLF